MTVATRAGSHHIYYWTPLGRFLPKLGPLHRGPFFARPGPAPLRLGQPGSERLDPGPQLDLPGPSAAVLAVEVEILLGDGVGVEQAVRAAPAGTRIARLADTAVDDEMTDHGCSAAPVRGQGSAPTRVGRTCPWRRGSSAHSP